MGFRSKNARLAYAIFFSFLVLSIASTFFPSLIEYTIIQSLGLPVLLISIINFIGSIIQNADDICASKYDISTQEHDYLEEYIKDTESKSRYKTNRMVKLSKDVKMYEQVDKILKKYNTVISVIDMVVLTLFVLTAILRPTFLRAGGYAIGYWSLTVLLASTYFKSSLSYKLFNKLLVKVNDIENGTTTVGVDVEE